LFFFQAEDGIRDGHVTGVLTCALPISWASAGAQLLSSLGDWIETSRRKVITLRRYATGLDHPDDVQAVTRSSQARLKQKRSSISSEERRVGKKVRFWCITEG